MNSKISKKKILFLFVHLHKGGMQRAVSNISQALPDKYEQFVGFFGTENPGFVYKAGMVDFKLPPTPNNKIHKKLANAFKRFIALREFVNHNNIDAVISFGDSANVYSILSWHRARKIITSRVALEESLSECGPYARFYLWIIKRIYKYANEAVAVSEELAERLKFLTQYKISVVTIPNLFHLDKIKKLSMEVIPEKYSCLTDKKILLNVGSLCYQKAQDDLLIIFEKIYRKHDDVHLVIIGRGEWRNKLYMMAVKMNIVNQITFIDFDANPYKYMSKAAAFVMTSRYEGFPNVLVEAMACGCPVVAFDCPTGPREILDKTSIYGRLITKRDHHVFVKNVSQILLDYELQQQMKSLSIKRSMHYAASDVVLKWENVLKKI